MKVKIQCPNCAQKYVVDGSLIGQAVKCENCGTSFPAKKQNHKKAWNIIIVVSSIIGVLFCSILVLGSIAKSMADRDYIKGLEAKKEHRDEEALEFFRKAAEKGHTEAQFELGMYYEAKTDGTEEDEDIPMAYWGVSEAVYWFDKAASNGHTEAKYKMGKYYQSIGNEMDMAFWFLSAAASGHKDAQFEIGRCCLNGSGVPLDYDVAEMWFKRSLEQGNTDVDKYLDIIGTIKAAKQGDAYAQYKLGGLYLAGDVIEQNNNEALNWLRKSADQGNENAQFELGSLYYGKGGVLKKNMAKAIDWWLKAANLGHAKAQFNIGACFYNGNGMEKDLTEAVKWFRKAADQGYMDAQYNLGIIYFFGGGSDEEIEEDIVESTKWYLKAAQQGKEEAIDFLSSMGSDNELISDAVRGNADAQFMLAESLRKNLKWDKSIEDTRKNSLMFRWYKKAAEQGNWKAQYNLGVCYYKRYDMLFFSREEEFSNESIEWFSKAAEQGHAKAQCILGYVYYYGRNSSYGTEIRANVEKDKSKALAWFQKAADQGDETAINNLRVLPDNGKIKKPVIEWNEQEEIGKNKKLNEAEKTIGNKEKESEGSRKLISYIFVDAISRPRFNGLEYAGIDGEKYYAAEFHELSKSIELFNANKKRIKAIFNVVSNNRKLLKHLEIGDTFKHNNIDFKLVDIKLETTSDGDGGSGYYFDEDWKGTPVAYIQRVGKKERIACHPKQPVYDPVTRVRFLNTLSDRTFVSSVDSTFKLGDAKTGEEQYKIVSADRATKEIIVESVDKDRIRYRLSGSSVQEESKNTSSMSSTGTEKKLTDAERARLKVQEKEINRRSEQMMRSMGTPRSTAVRAIDANSSEAVIYGGGGYIPPTTQGTKKSTNNTVPVRKPENLLKRLP